MTNNIVTLSIQKIAPGVVRNLSAVSLHKVVQVAGLAVTVAVVPRLFGAETYGRFAFVLSLSYLGQILGDFGTLDVMGRFVPGMPHAKASRLYMRHLAFKGVIGLLCALITALAALILAPWMSPAWAGLVGIGVWLHIVAWVPFQFSLGLNRIGTWMSEQAWRQWALLGLLLALLPPFGLGGALMALVVMEFLFCGLGLWWTRDYWHTAALRFDWPYLRPYVRFGVGFFLANLAAVALYRSGPLLVEIVTGESAQTGYFNLALGLFLLAYVTLGQFAQSLIPALSNFYAGGQPEQMHLWLQNFVRYGWLLTWLGVLAVWLTAGWAVPLVFGDDFGPASALLRWISVGVPVTVLVWAGNVTATVTARGRVKFAASLAALVVFGLAAISLIPGYGAVGAAWALGLSSVINAATLYLFLYPDFAVKWRMVLTSGAASVLILAGMAWLSG